MTMAAHHHHHQHAPIAGPDPTSDQEFADRWEQHDPRRDRTAIAYTDSDTHALIDQAAYLLTIFRAPMSFGDAAVAVSVLVSLAVEAQDQLHEAVADARDQGYTWDEIADRLNISVTTARRRYRAYTN
jgi:DNA-directed RNA polymerase specialized sigma24 family protein